MQISSRAYKRVFTCKIWLRYSQERASQSLPKNCQIKVRKTVGMNIMNKHRPERTRLQRRLPTLDFCNRCFGSLKGGRANTCMCELWLFTEKKSLGSGPGLDMNKTSPTTFWKPRSTHVAGLSGRLAHGRAELLAKRPHGRLRRLSAELENVGEALGKPPTF